METKQIRNKVFNQIPRAAALVPVAVLAILAAVSAQTHSPVLAQGRKQPTGRHTSHIRRIKGRRTANRQHHSHLRPRWHTRRGVHLPMAPHRRRRRPPDRRRRRPLVHPLGRRRRQEHQGVGRLYRPGGQPGRSPHQPGNNRGVEQFTWARHVVGDRDRRQPGRQTARILRR